MVRSIPSLGETVDDVTCHQSLHDACGCAEDSACAVVDLGYGEMEGRM